MSPAWIRPANHEPPGIGLGPPNGAGLRFDSSMQVSAKVDYAMRALAELAIREPEHLLKADQIATSQGIPAKFLEVILNELRRAGLVVSRRGAEGGYRLARDPAEITVADVVRATEGPLAAVRGQRPEDVVYTGPAVGLQAVWIANRAATREVLEVVTLADVVANRLPASVAELLARPGAWRRR
jgi:Rrf2 family protein